MYTTLARIGPECIATVQAGWEAVQAQVFILTLTSLLRIFYMIKCRFTYDLCTISAHFWLLYHICSIKVPLLKLRAAFTPLGETVLEGREGNSGFSAQYLSPKCW